MYGSSHAARKFSESQLRFAVKLMFLKLSSLSGGVIFGINVIYSVTHCLGYIPDFVIELKMFATGAASSTYVTTYDVMTYDVLTYDVMTYG